MAPKTKQIKTRTFPFPKGKIIVINAYHIYIYMPLGIFSFLVTLASSSSVLPPRASRSLSLSLSLFCKLLWKMTTMPPTLSPSRTTCASLLHELQVLSLSLSHRLLFRSYCEFFRLRCVWLLRKLELKANRFLILMCENLFFFFGGNAKKMRNLVELIVSVISLF